MNLKMKTLAAAMIAAGSMASAQAAEVLFPYVVNSTTVTTVVSVINITAVNSTELHYRLWYKDGAAAGNNAANCVETNSLRSTSVYDIQTIDLGGHFGTSTLGVLFNDPSINNDYKAANKSYAYASFANKPMRGWLIIEDEVGLLNPTNAAAGALQGEAMVFDFSSGAAWGYQAGVSDLANLGADFSAANGTAPNVGYGNGMSLVNLAPFAETTTKFFVTPLTSPTQAGMMNASGNNNDNPGGTQDGYRLAFGFNTFAVVDRDENVYSGAIPQDVTCVGAVDAKALISGATLNQIPNGGWAPLIGAPRGAGVAGKDIIDAAVIKLDYNTAATFNGEAVKGVYNNAFVLKSL